MLLCWSIDMQPIPNIQQNDKQKIISAISKYKVSVESAEKRARLGRQKLDELKILIQKKSQSMVQAKRTVAAATAGIKKRRATIAEIASGNAQRSKAIREADEASRSSTRVKGVMTTLDFTAMKRRDQLKQKRNNSTSSTWVQNLPGVPQPLRKSLWYKMHRRRQQIVLRPPAEHVLTDLREKVTKRLTETNATKKSSNTNVEEEVINAEKKFLLAIHPTAPKGESVSSVPSSSKWAEPGKYCYSVLICLQSSLLQIFCRL